MAEVAVTLRLMPESAEVDMNGLEVAVRQRAKVHSVSKEPIAFGVEALMVVAVVQDAAGGSDPLEKELASIPGVGNVEVVSVTRLL